MSRKKTALAMTSSNGADRTRFWVSMTAEEADAFKAYQDKILDTTGVNVSLSRIVKEMALIGLASRA